MSRRVFGEFKAVRKRLSIWTALLTAWVPAASAGAQLIEGYWAGSQSPELTTASDGTSLVVLMSRGGCYGPCPIYWVGIGGSGLVEYQGHRFVLMEGRHSSRIPESAVDELRAAIESADFFSLEDSYGSCLDIASIEVHVEIGGTRRSVESSPACYQLWDQDGVSARELRDVERLERLHETIDRLAGTERWVGTKEQKEEKIRAEMAASRVAKKARIAELALLLRDDDASVRDDALGELAQMGLAAGPAAPELTQALSWVDDDQRRVILILLGRLGPRYATISVPALVESLRDPHGGSRIVAARSLGMLGPAAIPSLGLLTEIADFDPHEEVRRAAKEAIARIEGN